MTIKDGLTSLNDSHREKTKFFKDINKYKREKYGKTQEDIMYYRNGMLIFTCVIKHHNQKDRDVFLVITVTNQLINLKK